MDLVVPADSDTMATVLSRASTLNIGSLYGASDPPTYLTYDETRLPSALKTQMDTCDGNDNCKLVTADITDSGTLTANHVAAGTYESVDQTEKTTLLAIKHSNAASTISSITVGAGACVIPSDWVASASETFFTYFTYVNQGVVSTNNQLLVPGDNRRCFEKCLSDSSCTKFAYNASGGCYIYSGTSTSTTPSSGFFLYDRIPDVCPTNVKSYVATVTTTLPHLLNSGDYVKISGTGVPVLEVPSASVTLISATQFTYPVSVTTASSSQGIVESINNFDEFGIPEEAKKLHGTGVPDWRAPLVRENAAGYSKLYNAHFTGTSLRTVALSAESTLEPLREIQCATQCDLVSGCVGFNVTESTSSCVLYDRNAPTSTDTVNGDAAFIQGYTKRTFSSIDTDPNNVTTVPALSYGYDTLLGSYADGRWYNGAINYQPPAASVVDTFKTTMSRYIVKLSGAPPTIADESVEWDNNGRTCYNIDACNQTLMKVFADPNISSFLSSDYSACEGCPERGYSKTARKVLLSEVPAIKLASNYQPTVTINETLKRPRTIGGTDISAGSESRTNPYTYSPPGYGNLDEDLKSIVTSFTQFRVILDVNSVLDTDIKSKYVWYGHGGKSFLNGDTPINCANTVPNFGYGSYVYVNSSAVRRPAGGYDYIVPPEYSAYTGAFVETGGLPPPRTVIPWGCGETVTRTIAVTTPPSNGGQACPSTVQTKTFPSTNACFGPNGVDGTTYIAYTGPSGEGDVQTDLSKLDTISENSLWKSESSSYLIFKYEGGKYRRYPNLVIWRRHFFPTSRPTPANLPPRANRNPFPGGWSVNGVDGYKVLDSSKFGTPMPDPYAALGQIRTLFIPPSALAERWAYDNRKGCDRQCDDKTIGYSRYYCRRTTQSGNCDPSVGPAIDGVDCRGTFISCVPATTSADFGNYFAPKIRGLRYVSGIVHSGGSRTTHNTDSLIISVVYEADPAVVGVDTLTYGSLFPASIISTIQSCTSGITTSVGNCVCPAGKYYTGRTDIYDIYGSCKTCMMTLAPNSIWVGAACQTRICESGTTPSASKTECAPIFTCPPGAISNASNGTCTCPGGLWYDGSTCNPCSNPAANQYVAAVCTPTADTLFDTDASITCINGSTFLARNQGDAANTGSSSVCSWCSYPYDYQYVTAACTPTADTVFESDAALTCISGSTFLVRNQGSPSSAGSPSVCRTCGNPPANQYVTEECTPTTDTVFATDTVPTCSLGITFLRNMIPGSPSSTGSPSACIQCSQPPGGDDWQTGGNDWRTYVSAVCTLVTNTQFAVYWGGLEPSDRCPPNDGLGTYYIPGDIGSSTRVGRPLECRACREPRPDQYVLTRCGATTDTVFGTQPVCEVYDDQPYNSTYLLPSTNTGNSVNTGTRGKCVPCGRGITGKYVTAKCTPTSNTQYDTQLTSSCLSRYTFDYKSRGDATTLGNETRCTRCSEPVSTSTIFEYVAQPCAQYFDTLINTAPACYGTTYRKGFSSGSSIASGSEGECVSCTEFISPYYNSIFNVGKYVSRACGGLYDTGVSPIPACAQSGYYRPMPSALDRPVTSPAAYGTTTSVGVIPECVQCSTPSAALNQYTLTACTVGSNTVFGTQPVCTLGETYLAGYTTGTALTPGTEGTCIACDYPYDPYEFVSGLCTLVRNTQFTQITPCVAGQTFSTTPNYGTPTALGTNSCTACTDVPAILPGESVPARFVVAECTPTTDTVLSDQPACAGFLRYTGVTTPGLPGVNTPGSPGQSGQPATCTGCSAPNSRIYQYVSAVCRTMADTTIVTPVSVPTCSTGACSAAGACCVVYEPGSAFRLGKKPVCTLSAYRYLSCTIAADGGYMSPDIINAKTYMSSLLSWKNPFGDIIKAQQLDATSCAIVFTTRSIYGSVTTRYKYFRYAAATGCNIRVIGQGDTGVW